MCAAYAYLPHSDLVCYFIYINVNTEKHAKYAYDKTVSYETDLGFVIAPLFVTQSYSILHD